MEKYPSVHRYYDITVTDNGKGTASSISCKHKTGEDTEKKAGIYFLRTTLDENDEKTLWAIYNVIREIEYTFYAPHIVMQSDTSRHNVISWQSAQAFHKHFP